jgi:hypothetical protein
MAKYIEQEDAYKTLSNYYHHSTDNQHMALREALDRVPAADVVEEENILKFYYVRSIDEYWIGRRIDNFYYAEYDPESRQWTWTHSRYLPWGEHIVSPTSLWKEYTYPSEPEEIPFAEWLQGFIKKHADVVERKTGKWISYIEDGYLECPFCGAATNCDGDESELHFCFSCGAKMEVPTDV